MGWLLKQSHKGGKGRSLGWGMEDRTQTKNLDSEKGMTTRKIGTIERRDKICLALKLNPK